MSFWKSIIIKKTNKGQKMEMTNKTALHKSWIFMKSNWLLSIGSTVILLFLTIFSVIPYIGVFVSIFTGLIVYSYQIYAGKKISFANDEEIVKIAKSTTFGNYFFQYFEIAFAQWLATIFIFGLLALLYFVTGIMPAMNEWYAYHSIGIITAVINISFLLFFAFLFYVYPAVVGKVIKSENFKDAFKSVFYLINPSFWKKTFNSGYFKLTFVWGLILFAGIVVGEILALIIVGFFVIYYIGLYSAVIFVYSEEITEKTTSTL